jgi:hypothetical protein
LKLNAKISKIILSLPVPGKRYLTSAALEQLKISYEALIDSDFDKSASRKLDAIMVLMDD